MESVEDWPGITAWRAYVDELDGAEPYVETYAVTVKGAEGAAQLARYWEHGEGAAKVRWGTDGAMKRCIRLNRKHMRDPGGYCAKRHKAVTGEWPTTGGEHGIPS